jgi:hypothetical protein
MKLLRPKGSFTSINTHPDKTFILYLSVFFSRFPHSIPTFHLPFNHHAILVKVLIKMKRQNNMQIKESPMNSSTFRNSQLKMFQNLKGRTHAPLNILTLLTKFPGVLMFLKYHFPFLLGIWKGFLNHLCKNPN